MSTLPEQTSRTNITEALDHLRRHGCNVFHAEGPCPWQRRRDNIRGPAEPSAHDQEGHPFRFTNHDAPCCASRAALAAEPRSDAVAAPDLIDHEAARREALDTAWPQLREERRSDAVTAQPNPSDSASPDEPSTWKELIAAGRASGIEARAASASVPPLDEATEGDIRYLLWVLHGHEGRYGDDGEMQCGWCHLDYRRDPLSKITAHLTSLSSSLDRYAAETPEQGRGDE